MRDYDIYYAPKRINVIETPTQGATITTGTTFFGVRVQNLLLKPGNFYRQCGFYSLRDIESLSGEENSTVSA